MAFVAMAMDTTVDLVRHIPEAQSFNDVTNEIFMAPVTAIAYAVGVLLITIGITVFTMWKLTPQRLISILTFTELYVTVGLAVGCWTALSLIYSLPSALGLHGNLKYIPLGMLAWLTLPLMFAPVFYAIRTRVGFNGDNLDGLFAFVFITINALVASFMAFNVDGRITHDWLTWISLGGIVVLTANELDEQACRISSDWEMRSQSVRNRVKTAVMERVRRAHL
jgi:uncharacterized membrane protein